MHQGFQLQPSSRLPYVKGSRPRGSVCRRNFTRKAIQVEQACAPLVLEELTDPADKRKCLG